MLPEFLDLTFEALVRDVVAEGGLRDGGYIDGTDGDDGGVARALAADDGHLADDFAGLHLREDVAFVAVVVDDLSMTGDENVNAAVGFGALADDDIAGVEGQRTLIGHQVRNPVGREASEIFEEELDRVGKIVVGLAAENAEAFAGGGGGEVGLETLGEFVEVEEDDALGGREQGIGWVSVDLALAAIGDEELGGGAVDVGDLLIALLVDHAGELHAFQIGERLGVAAEDDGVGVARVGDFEAGADGGDRVA